MGSQIQIQATIRYHPLFLSILLSFSLPFNGTHVNVGKATQGVGSLPDCFQMDVLWGKLSIGQKKNFLYFFFNVFIFAYTGSSLVCMGFL